MTKITYNNIRFWVCLSLALFDCMAYFVMAKALPEASDIHFLFVMCAFMFYVGAFASYMNVKQLEQAAEKAKGKGAP